MASEGPASLADSVLDFSASLRQECCQLNFESLIPSADRIRRLVPDCRAKIASKPCPVCCAMCCHCVDTDDAWGLESTDDAWGLESGKVGGLGSRLG